MKIAFTLLITLGIFSSTFAQDLKTPLIQKTKIRIHTFGMRSELIVSDISPLSHESILSMVKDPKQVSHDMDTYELTDQYLSEGLSVGAFMRLSHLQMGRLTTEVELGMDYFVHSEIFVDYENENSADLPYLGWCLMQDRADFQAAYWFVTDLDRKWNFRFGPSINGGRSLNDHVLIFDEEYSFEPVETMDARSTSFVYGYMNAQIFRPAFGVFDLGFGAKYGKGV